MRWRDWNWKRSRREYKLTEATRYLTDLELLTGVEVEREEEEDGETKNVATPRIEVEFVIPIFDTGKPRMRKAELAYMQAANRLAEKAVNVRSEARSAYDAYRSTYDIARHYRNSVVPLRKKIEEESVLTYNGMITNTFELLADTRARIEANIQALQATSVFLDRRRQSRHRRSWRRRRCHPKPSPRPPPTAAAATKQERTIAMVTRRQLTRRRRASGWRGRLDQDLRHGAARSRPDGIA